tara:strand:- start:53 stop:244 length:192 start_codon:yes stop_codon:yes gene_type:complete
MAASLFQPFNHTHKQTMKNINETIASLSIDIACLLDEPSEVTKDDLLKIQDLVTKLENDTQKP